MADHILQKHPGGTVVTPVSSSSLIEDVAKRHDARVIWTQVGSIYVARTMKATGAVFGGEGNGGLIFPQFQYCRDGGMSAASMLELLAHTGEKLSAIVEAMPAYYSVKEKIKCKDKEAVMRDVMAHAAGEKVDATDGLKIYRPEGWVLVRMSGTEPIIRIFAESRSESGARKLADYGVGLVNRLNK
jgi:phosphomannomutase/phosphoglucomutase